MSLSSTEVLTFLRDIERRVITLRCLDAEVTYCGDAHYRASNGWEITVFVDCNEFDYVDRVETPDGRHWQFPQRDEGFENNAVVWYRAPDDVARTCYRIPVWEV